MSVNNQEYWLTDPILSPKIKDFTPEHSVSVSQRCPPWAFGRIVAFFVGEDMRENAQAYIDMMNSRGEGNDR